MTTGTHVHGVRVLGDGVPYLDGAEDRLYDIVASSPDRSSRSDALASHITDWPSRYHLSRLRSNLLLPLRISEGTRVLDVGCGTGVLSRSLAERGAEVTGVEGSLARARVAAARTSGQPNAEVICGSLEEYTTEGHQEEFDIVLLCGVLEYSVSMLGGEGGPARMLEQVRSLLKPDGALVIAIENQIGLKYLLWYPEDHRSLPWIGLDGYRSGRNPAKTWTRKALSELLAGSGLGAQQWLFPYPDYKMPTVVAHSDLFSSAEGANLAGLFIRNPVQDYAHGSMLTADPLTAFGVMLSAGLAMDTANSFLVVAGRDGSDPSRTLEDGLLWLSSGERSSELMDRRVLRRTPNGFSLSPLSDRAEVHLPPLVSGRSDVPVVLGSNLEDEIVAQASGATSPDDLRPILTEWWEAARHQLRQEGQGACRFDVVPRNFIRTHDGQLAFIDHEWSWAEDVPDAWPLLRSLWFLFLQRLWPSGSTAGISWSVSLGDAVLAIAKVIDPRVGEGDLDEAVRLEAELQSRVQGIEASQESAGLRSLLGRPLTALAQQPSMAQVFERPIISQEQAQDREEAARLKELAVQDDLLGTKAEVSAMARRLDEAQARIAWLQGRQGVNPKNSLRRVKGRLKSRGKSEVKRVLSAIKNA